MRTATNIVAGALVVFLSLSLILIAVQNVRDAAARTQCWNNLKQIGLARFNYHDTFQYFPLATMPNPRLKRERHFSWLLEIYPFVESSDLYKLTDREKAWDAEENHWVALERLKTYLCPGFPVQRPTSVFTPSHYIGIAGLGADAAMLPLDDPRASALGYDRKWNLNYPKRRATNTLIVVADTTRVAEAWTAGGWPTARGLEDDGPPLIGPGGQFGGVHKAGAMVAYADGSVGVIPPADSERFKSMCTLRDNAAAISPPEN
jgi:prepilin-type processing-associated H-X9-DG protein